jgi:hypothetical protein
LGAIRKIVFDGTNYMFMDTSGNIGKIDTSYNFLPGYSKPTALGTTSTLSLIIKHPKLYVLTSDSMKVLDLTNNYALIVSTTVTTSSSYNYIKVSNTYHLASFTEKVYSYDTTTNLFGTAVIYTTTVKFLLAYPDETIYFAIESNKVNKDDFITPSLTTISPGTITAAGLYHDASNKKLVLCISSTLKVYDYNMMFLNSTSVGTAYIIHSVVATDTFIIGFSSGLFCIMTFDPLINKFILPCN